MTYEPFLGSLSRPPTGRSRRGVLPGANSWDLKWVAALGALAALLLLLAPAGARADDGVGDVDQSLTVNLLDALNGIVNFEIEHALNDHGSVFFGVDFIFFNSVFEDSSRSIWGVGPDLGFRLYLLGNAPLGLWLGPFGELAYVRSDDHDHLGWALGGMAGLNFLVLGPLEAQLGVGAAWHDYAIHVNGDTVGLDGWDPRFRLGVGVAW